MRSNLPNFTWNDQAITQEIDGVPVGMSTKPIKELHLFYQGQRYMFIPPEPTPMFAFNRYSVGMENETHWLYSLFGYVTDLYRVALVIGTKTILFDTSLRSTPFEL